MLTPGTSQDNIRGFFYRGNVNIGGGAREYSNGFVVDGVNNTWAQMGEPRQNFAMDAIREFKVSTSNYKAEYGLATGGLLTVVSKSGTNQWHGSGLLFLRDKALTARSYFEAVKPDFRRYQYRRHDRRAGRPQPHALLRGLRRHRRKPVLHGRDARRVAAVRRHLPEQAEALDLFDEGRSSADADARRCSCATRRRTNTARSSRPAAARIRPTASTSRCRDRPAVVGHTWVLGPRALNDFRFQYAFAKFEVSPPYSHGSWEPGDFGADRLSFCTPVFSYPTITVGGCGNSQMGPEARVELKNDFSYLMNKWGGAHQWKMGVDYSHVTFSSDNLNSPLGAWMFPRDEPYNANDRSDVAHAVHQHAADLRRHSGDALLRLSAGRLADRPRADAQSRASLRRAVRRRSTRTSRICRRASPRSSGPASASRCRFRSSKARTAAAIATTSARASASRGIRGTAAAPTSTRAYGMFYDNMRTLQNFDELTWPQGKTIVISNPSLPRSAPGRARAISSSPETRRTSSSTTTTR